jgi:hypothetical protein
MTKEKSIRLHPEFGVNPTVLQCPICGDEYGVALLGYNRGKEAPRVSCDPNSICGKCEEHRKIGIILIETRDGESGKNPHRTGRLWVVKEEFFTRAGEPDSNTAEILKSRVAFITRATADAMGLPDPEPEKTGG